MLILSDDLIDQDSNRTDQAKDKGNEVESDVKSKSKSKGKL